MHVSSRTAQSRSIVCLLVVLVTLLPFGGLSAEEMMLRCDSATNETDVIVLSIEMSGNAVHMGTNPDTGWWRDGDEFEKSSEDESVDEIHCVYTYHQYVHVSDKKIGFGTWADNKTSCFYNWRTVQAGKNAKDWEYNIDRVTGILTETFEVNSYKHSEIRYQCQKFRGNAF